LECEAPESPAKAATISSPRVSATLPESVAVSTQRINGLVFTG